MRVPLSFAAPAMLLIAACAPKEPPRAADAGPLPAIAVEKREVMHTWVTIGVVTSDQTFGAHRAAVDAAFAVFDRVNTDLNEWDPASPLSKVNAGAGGPAVDAPADLCDAVRSAVRGAEETGGLFDPTWAALADVWRFADGETFHVPGAAEIEARCRDVDWRGVQVSGATPGPCRIRLRKGQRLGLGGIAKGWGVDHAVAVLRADGLKDFFVQAGGDLYFAGGRGAHPWHAGIRDPRGGPDEVIATVDVRDAAFSTSGDYEHFAIVDGVRYHHIIDPRNCRPATASRSATVLAASATDAEWLTKSTFIAGGGAALELARTHGAAVILVRADGSLLASPALEGRVTLARPPR